MNSTTAPTPAKKRRGRPPKVVPKVEPVIEHCRTCDHYVKTAENGQAGVCTRYPAWRTVSMTHYCGEWKAEDEKTYN